MPLTRIVSRGITDGTITASDFASGVGGKVLQVVQSTTTTVTSTSSGTFTDVLNGASTWETSITPTTSGNKILVMPTIKIGAGFGSNAEQRGTIITQMKIGSGSYSDFIAEGTQNTGSYDYGSGSVGVGVYVFYNLTKLYTTSSIDTHTFKFRIKVSGGQTNVNQGGDVPAFITLFEIAS